MLRLEDFPRPKDDNGRGIHWSASPYHLSGHALDFWLDELQAMNIKWVKVLDDGGASSLELCRRLVDLGIMPVVRLYLGNPGHVDSRSLEAIRRLIDAGVFYFETNNEPDLAIEWPNGVIPRNWLDLVVDNFIIDATEIINLGGFPAFPAMGVGTIVNPFQLIVQRGRKDLFDNGAWVAIHNYVLNHPLDYPYDEVNQTGRPLTPEEYERDRWGWDNDSIDTINRLRKEGAHPGATIYDDATGWLAYTLWNEQIVDAFGHSVPIMSTEGGVVVGDRQDGRYPRNDVRRHEEVTLWIQDFLSGKCPEWYFTVFHWLIANNAMGQNRPGWETQAWYGHWWDKEFGLNGHLPTVDALKRTAASPRPEVRSDGVIRGYVMDALGQPAADRRLWALCNGTVIRETATRSDGRYTLWGLPPGKYDLRVQGTMGFPIIGLEIAPHAEVHRDIQLPGPQSGVGGRLTYPDGKPCVMQTIKLYQGERLVASTVSERAGYYGFLPLAAGEYRLEVRGASPLTVTLDGLHPVTANFNVPTGGQYAFQVVKRRLLPESESRGRHAFFGTVLDEAGTPIDGVKILMSWTGAAPGTQFPVAITGSDPGKPRGYFEFINTAGEFCLTLLDVPWPAQPADGLKTAGWPGQRPDESITYEIVFQLVYTEGQPAASIVSGTILGASDGMHLALHSQTRLYSTRLGASGTYRFDHLAADTYALELEGLGTIAEAVIVDGQSLFIVPTIDIRPNRKSVIEGRVLDTKGQPRPEITVFLLLNGQREQLAVSDSEGRYRFTALAPGIYRLQTTNPPATSPELAVDGTQAYHFDMHLPEDDQPRPLAHYLLFGPLDTPTNRVNFRLARQYILRAQVTAGFSVEEALAAQRVTIVGDESLITRETEEKLRAAGCQVGRLSGDSYAVADSFARLLENSTVKKTVAKIENPKTFKEGSHARDSQILNARSRE